MTSKTSILLIIQQNPGIDYQTLLSKIAPNYANLNSSRAALSRVLKDAVSFGMVSRMGHQLFLTDKGMAGLKVKMHDKLIIKLNQLMKVRSVATNPDPLVQNLSVLLERGKMDPRLLDNARASVGFSVNDLEKVFDGLQENIRHLQYVEKTLHGQIQSLREQNFPSSHATKITDLLPHVSKLIEVSNAEDVQVEHGVLHGSTDHPLLTGFPSVPKGNRVSISHAHLHEMLSRLPQQEATFNGMRAFLGMITLDLSRDTAIIRGPSNVIEKLSADIPKSAESSSPAATAPPGVPGVPMPFEPAEPGMDPEPEDDDGDEPVPDEQPDE